MAWAASVIAAWNGMRKLASLGAPLAAAKVLAARTCAVAACRVSASAMESGAGLALFICRAGEDDLHRLTINGMRHDEFALAETCQIHLQVVVQEPVVRRRDLTGTDAAE